MLIAFWNSNKNWISKYMLVPRKEIIQFLAIIIVINIAYYITKALLFFIFIAWQIHSVWILNMKWKANEHINYWKPRFSWWM